MTTRIGRPARATHHLGPTKGSTAHGGGDGRALPLLGSKWAIPPGPPEMIDRPRLRRAIEDAVHRPVTLVSAPPGYGKTTLLSSWARATMIGWPIAWLTLEPADAGTRFRSYLHAAFTAAGVHGPPGQDLPAPGFEPDEGYLTRLVDALSGTACPAVLILDDVQVLTDPGTLGGIAFLVRHAHERVRVVLSTRGTPALPLQRWRVNGELSELGSADLSFTAAETATLLGRQGSPVPHDQLTVLHERTEGWAAGLRLATLSLRAAPDPARFVHHFGGGHGSVADYLVHEVLAQQGPATQHLLLCTAVVSRICGELADVLTGATGSGHLLAELEHANAFVRPLGGRQGWYRYSRLFGDLLYARLHQQATSERIRELNRHAAAWHTLRGTATLALRHALAGQDWQVANGVLAAHWQEFPLTGEGDPLRGGPIPPPPEQLRADPALALAYAADRLDVGDRDGAVSYLGLADSLRHLVGSESRERFALIAGRFRLAAARPGGDVAAVMPPASRHLVDLSSDTGLADPGDLTESGRASVAGRLSPRELTVVHYLQSPLTKAEIAAELSLSVHTVKTHVRSIYRKLGVTRRREAVRRARDLHLP